MTLEKGASVFLKAVRNQLLHDLRASWQKSLVLGCLLIVGLYFWIPPLYQAIFGSARTARAEAATTATVSPETLAAARAAADQTATDSARRPMTWENAAELLATDPLVRPADLAVTTGNPFEISPDQFAPPVLFAEDEPQDAKNPSKSASAGKTTPSGNKNLTTTNLAEAPQGVSGLVLKSTILGASRRAALINDTLYSEGATIEWNGESYLVAAVRARQVELKKGEESLLLDLPGLTSTNGIRIERVGEPQLQPQ